LEAVVDGRHVRKPRLEQVRTTTAPSADVRTSRDHIFAPLPDTPERRNAPLGLRINEPYNPRRARLGWVRAAFLVAFAWLGNRYILHPALQPLRVQLLNPEDEILSSLPIITDPARIGLPAERSVAPMETPLE
jgi:hypothetical protein